MNSHYCLGKMLSNYVNPDYRACLAFNKLDSFEQLWGYQAGWFEEPNHRRGGWSGVGRLQLTQPEGGECKVFLKRQEAHQRRTFRHPFRGEPTFACEFRMMRYLGSRGVPAPVPVFFSDKIIAGRPKAILMTQELEGYESLDVITSRLFSASVPKISAQHSIIRAVARTVKKLHSAGIQHRSLYPKHLFVLMKEDVANEVAVIDLEKSRKKLIPAIRTVYDLATLSRHAECWSRSARMYFLHQYFGVKKLTPWQRLLCRLIVRRSQRRK